MTIPLITLVGKILIVGYTAAKVVYAINQVQKHGWDPQKIIYSLWEDTRAVYGFGGRSALIAKLIWQANECETFVAANAVAHEVDALIKKIKADGSLADRALTVIDKLPHIQRIAYTSAGFHLAMRPESDFIGVGYSDDLETALLGLYLYGKTGACFSDIAELGNVVGKLTAVLETLSVGDDEYAATRSILQTLLPNKTAELERSLVSLQEIADGIIYTGDDHFIDYILYALNMADVSVIHRTTVGSELYERFRSKDL